MTLALGELRLRVTTDSPEETIQFATQFANDSIRFGKVIALFGELGAGKTHFVKGIAAACGIDMRELTSPTYALANEYRCTIPTDGAGILYHLDCYRFEKPEELLELGVEDYLHPVRGATVIEWAERIEKYLYPGVIAVRMKSTGEHTREISIETL